ncbi:MAG: Hsp70 family protein [Lachnospira sp.]|nr:Hsp70 family protein [Lachnospira sp.]
MAIVGIDLGTTNSLIAVYRNGKSELIPNEFGEYLTPSVVHINKDKEVIVGKSAKELLIVDPDNTVSVFKRSMGLKKSYSLRGGKYQPEELSAFVIKKLVEDARRELKEDIEEVIISVPAYFDDVRRKATKRAGEIAGVKVERLINEPSAAALACRMEEEEEDCIYMVFDFGGGTLDVSIVECFDNVISVNAVSGDNHLGGSDFDDVIAKYICKELGKEYKKLSKQDQSIVLRKAEQLKKKLSVDREAEISLDLDAVKGTVSLTQEKLVEISAKIFSRMKKPIRQVLNDCEFRLEDISKIVLVGGSSKMTVVSMYLYYLLQKDLFTSGDSDETVALGLGYYAGMKSRNEDIRDLVMTDICPFSLGVDTHNESDIANPYFSPIISRNSVLPISKWDYYTTAHNNQREIELNIYQGDEYYAKNNIHLGKMSVKVKPRPAGEEKIKVRFTYDINGILDVDVEVESTRMTYQKTIVNKELGLSDKELQKQMEKLTELKKDPKSKEENQYLITLANALYRETSGDVRNYIAGIIDYFDRVLSEGNEAKIEHIRKRLMVVLSNIEAGLFDFSFDEREYEEEEYEEERMFIDSLREELDTDEEQLYIRSLTKEPDEEEK